MALGITAMQTVLCLVLFASMAEACNSNFFNAFFQAVSRPTTNPNTPSTIAPGSCKCGRANRITKIVGGAEASENEYPWQVGLLERSWSNRPFCGGTLISSKEVLTAAHCTQPGYANYVVLGEHILNAEDGQKVVKVCSVIDNPNWNQAQTNYDFSILRLCEEVPFRTDISPACLPTSNSANYDNREAVVSGWGTLNSFGSSPNVLHEVTIQTMSNAQCYGSNTDYSSSQITDQMICAAAANKDSCQGDSGGPLVTKESGTYYTLIGVTSWGLGCAEARAPGVYARVTSVLGWINQNIQGSTCTSS